MADLVNISMSGATLCLVAERLFSIFVAPKMRTKEERQARAGETSGEKDPAFWEKKFGQIFDEKLDQRVLPILEKQTSIQESLARTMEGMATQLKELTDVSRKARRR